MNAGMSVISGASSERKISSSSTRIKTTVRASSWLPVDPVFFCWSTWMATAPARCTCRPDGGPARAMVLRRLSMSVVSPVWSPPPTVDCTWICSAWPSPDRPRSVTRTTVGTCRRSCSSVLSQATSAAASCPWLTAATTGTGVRLVPPNGAARSAACWLGALAGRKLALLPCVTLARDGQKARHGHGGQYPHHQDDPAELDRECTDAPENPVNSHGQKHTGGPLRAD